MDLNKLPPSRFGQGVWPWNYYGVANNISDRAKEAYVKLVDFVENDCIPAEVLYEKQLGEGPERFQRVPPVIEELKAKARSLGLWNMFMTKDYTENYGVPGPMFSTLEYGLMCELLGSSSLAPESTNCAAPDTGNMHLLARFANPEQKQKYLQPLLNGEVRSVFSATDADVASSDMTNIATRIDRDRNTGDYIVNGRKTWQSSFFHPKCAFLICVGLSAADNADRHSRQSVIIIPKNTPGIHPITNLKVLGFDSAPFGHALLEYRDCRVPKENLILGEGRGFEIFQGRLGPGRIHYGMRALGVAERVIERMVAEAVNPKKRPFGKLKGEYGTTQTDIAEARLTIAACRGLVLMACDAIDRLGPKGAQREIGYVKIFVPRAVQHIIDRAMQLHGGHGLSQLYELAREFEHMRIYRMGDGPDEVHLWQLGKAELKRANDITKKLDARKKREDELLARGRL